MDVDDRTTEMQREIEELKNACKERDERFANLSEELVNLRTQHETETKLWNQKNTSLQKQKDGLVEYFTPLFQFINNENAMYSSLLNDLDLSLQLTSPSPPLDDSSSGEGSDDDSEQLRKFLRDGEEFGFETKKKLLKRKLSVLKGTIKRQRAEMKRAEQAAESRRQRILQEQQEQLERLESQKRTYSSVDKILEASSQQAGSVDEVLKQLKAKETENLYLKNSLKQIEVQSENRTLSNPTNEMERSKPAKVRFADETTEAASSSSGDFTEAFSSIISTSMESDAPADLETLLTTETPSCSRDSPEFKTVLRYGKTLNVLTDKRKGQPRDNDEAESSKRTKPTIIATCEGEENAETKSAPDPRVAVLEKENLRLKIKVKALSMGNIRLQKAMREGGAIDLKNTTTESGVSATVTAQTLKIIREYEGKNPCLYTSITRQDGWHFAGSKYCHFATFSKAYYDSASSKPRFLIYKPLGMTNPRNTFCYMNSVLQALGAIPRFAISLVFMFETKGDTLLNALYQTYRHIWIRRANLRNHCRPTVLEANEIRNYYAQNRSHIFDPNLQHDAEEFLADFIGVLEEEVSLVSGGVEEQNFATKLFRGYITRQDGTKDYFRTLRLSIKHDKIDSVQKALFYHLRKASAPAVPPPAKVQDQLSPCSSSSSSNYEEEIDNQENSEETSQPETNPNSCDRSISIDEFLESEKSELGHCDEDAKQTVETTDSTTSTASASEGSSSEATNKTEDDSLDSFSFENIVPENMNKIFCPDILCVCIDRHTTDYDFNWKILPAEDLIIPAGLRAPEGTVNHAHYKLMSIIQYVPATSSSGHYYNYVMSLWDHDCMLNDDMVSLHSKHSINRTRLNGRSSMFFYNRRPVNLP